MSVIIRLQGLPWTASSLDIRKFFQGLSIPPGGVHIIGGNKGEAFIAFSTDEDARKAMMFNFTPLNGSVMQLFLSSKSEMQTVIEQAQTPPDQPATTNPTYLPSADNNEYHPRDGGSFGQDSNYSNYNQQDFANMNSRNDQYPQTGRYDDMSNSGSYARNTYNQNQQGFKYNNQQSFDNHGRMNYQDQRGGYGMRHMDSQQDQSLPYSASLENEQQNFRNSPLLNASKPVEANPQYPAPTSLLQDPTMLLKPFKPDVDITSLSSGKESSPKVDNGRLSRERGSKSDRDSDRRSDRDRSGRDRDRERDRDRDRSRGSRSDRSDRSRWSDRSDRDRDRGRDSDSKSSRDRSDVRRNRDGIRSDDKTVGDNEKSMTKTGLVGIDKNVLSESGNFPSNRQNMEGLMQPPSFAGFTSQDQTMFPGNERSKPLMPLPGELNIRPGDPVLNRFGVPEDPERDPDYRSKLMMKQKDGQDSWNTPADADFRTLDHSQGDFDSREDQSSNKGLLGDAPAGHHSFPGPGRQELVRSGDDRYSKNSNFNRNNQGFNPENPGRYREDYPPNRNVQVYRREGTGFDSANLSAVGGRDDQSYASNDGPPFNKHEGPGLGFGNREGPGQAFGNRDGPGLGFGNREGPGYGNRDVLRPRFDKEPAGFGNRDGARSDSKDGPGFGNGSEPRFGNREGPRPGFVNRDRHGFSNLEGPNFGNREEQGFSNRDGPGFGNKEGIGFGSGEQPRFGNREGPGLSNREGPGFGNREGPGFGKREGPGFDNREGPGFGNREGPGYRNREGPGYGNREGPEFGNREGPGFGNREGPGPGFGNREGSGPGFGNREGPGFGNREGPGFGNRDMQGFDNRDMQGFGNRDGPGFGRGRGGPGFGNREGPGFAREGPGFGNREGPEIGNREGHEFGNRDGPGCGQRDGPGFRNRDGLGPRQDHVPAFNPRDGPRFVRDGSRNRDGIPVGPDSMSRENTDQAFARRGGPPLMGDFPATDILSKPGAGFNRDDHGNNRNIHGPNFPRENSMKRNPDAEGSVGILGASPGFANAPNKDGFGLMGPAPGPMGLMDMDQRGMMPGKDVPYDRRPGNKHTIEPEPNTADSALKPEKRIYAHVKNLPYSTTLSEIRNFFQGAEITMDGIKLLHDEKGRKNGIGFIEFKTEDDLAKALQKFGEFFESRRMIITRCSQSEFLSAVDGGAPVAKRPRHEDEGHPKQNEPKFLVYMKGFPKHTVKEDIWKFFANCRIADNGNGIYFDHDGTGKLVGLAFIEFENHRAMQNALQLNGAMMGPMRIEVGPSHPEELNAMFRAHKSREMEVSSKMDSSVDQNERDKIKDTNRSDVNRNSTNRNDTNRNNSNLKDSKADIKTENKSKKEDEKSGEICAMLKNLPRQIKHKEIEDFFRGIKIVDNSIKFVCNEKGDTTDIGYVEFKSSEDCRNATKKSGNKIGHNSVKVESISKSSYNDKVKDLLKKPLASPIKKEIKEEIPKDSDPEVTSTEDTPLAKSIPAGVLRQHWFYLRCKNFPETVTIGEMLKFFSGYDPIPESIRLHYSSDGKPTGNAVIGFPTKDISESALKALNNQMCRNNKVEIFLA